MGRGRGGERLAPRLDRGDAAHHARVLQRGAEELGQERAHAGMGGPPRQLRGHDLRHVEQLRVEARARTRRERRPAGERGRRGHGRRGPRAPASSGRANQVDGRHRGSAAGRSGVGAAGSRGSQQLRSGAVGGPSIRVHGRPSIMRTRSGSARAASKCSAARARCRRSAHEGASQPIERSRYVGADAGVSTRRPYKQR